MIGLLKVSKRTPFLGKLLSDGSLTQKAFLNALASSLDYVARIVVFFLITPLMVSGLGDYYYGVWQILNRLVGYISLANGQPTQALKYTIANQQNSSDFKLKQTYVGSALIVFAIFLPVLSVLGGLLVWFVPYWIKTPPEYVLTLRITCGLLVMNLVVLTLVSIPRSVLQGENKGYKRMGLSTILVFVGGGITFLSLYFKAGIIGVSLSAVISSIISTLFYLKVVYQFSPWFGVARPSWSAVREFLGLSWWFLGWDIVMSLMTASDVVVLGFLNSVESVTNYTLSKYAPEMTISIVAIMVVGIIPGLGGIIGSGDYGKAVKVRGEIMTVTWLVGAVFGSGILLWNRTFVSLWVGGNHFVGGVSDLFIVLLVLQFIFIRTDANVINLTLNLKRKVILGFISVAISLFISSFLVYFLKLGIVGMCAGIILGRMVLSVQYPILIGRMLKVEIASQIKSIFRPAIVMAFLFVVALVLEPHLLTREWHSITGWVYFMLSVGITACIVFILAFFFGLTKKQRNKIFIRVRAILNLSM